jgi:hypothetical protein
MLTLEEFPRIAGKRDDKDFSLDPVVNPVAG